MESLNDNDDHNWQPKLIERIRMEKRKLWFRFLNFLFYMHDYDPYAIFKTDWFVRAKSPKHQIRKFDYHDDDDDDDDDDMQRESSLKMPYTKEDDFRRRITLPLRIFAVYYLIKSLTIAYAMHTLMRYEHLVPKYHYSQPLMSLETSKTLASYLGMPYYELQDIALGFITTAPCYCIVCIIVMPLYHRRNPMNIAQLRFLLEPRHELARVDASVRRRLAAISASLNVYRNLKHAFYRQRQGSYSQGPRQKGQAGYDLAHSELQYCHKIKIILEQFDRAHKSKFRPSTFTPRAYVKLTGRANLLVSGASVSYAICGPFIGLCLFYAAYSSKCPDGRFDCNPLDVLTWPELLIVLETTVCLAISSTSSILNIVLFGMLTLCQLDLIGAVKAELASCHRAIAGFIIDEHEGEEQRVRRRDKLEQLMLESITRLSIYDRELKDNARCISQQTVHSACFVASVVVLAAINVQFKLFASGLLRCFIVSMLWVSVNSVAVSCANIHARVLGLQRQLWSVLAVSSRLLAEESYSRQQQQLAAPSRRHGFEWSSAPQPGRQRSDGVRPCSFVADLWRKFVLSTSSNVEQHCSRLLTFKLSYQTIIEANFFSIFIYSLTLSPNDARAIN